MLRFYFWLLLLAVNLLCCNVIYAYTTTVIVSPSPQSIAVGSSDTFTVKGSYEGSAPYNSEETQNNCRWHYSGASVYSDASCTNVSTIARVTTATDRIWHRAESYQKVVAVTASAAGTCWIKFRMTYRFTDAINDLGKEIESEPIKVYVVGVKHIEYSTDGGTSFKTTSSRVYIRKGTKVIFKAIPEPTDAAWPNNMPTWTNTDVVTDTSINPTNAKNIAQKTFTNSTSITITAKCGTSSKSINFTSYLLDLIIDNMPDDDDKPKEPNEISPGILVGKDKRKKLTIKVEPTSIGGKINLTLANGIELYNAQTGGSKLTSRLWNVGSIPSSLYVQFNTESTTMRDNECKAEWTGITNFTPVDKAIVTVVKLGIDVNRWFNKNHEETIKITYSPGDLDTGNIKLSGLSNIFEIINSDFVENTNNVSATPQNGTLTWSLKREDTKAGKIIVKVKGITVQDGNKLEVEHATTGVKDEATVGVIFLDIIVDDIVEDKEETEGAFMAIRKRKKIEFKAEPENISDKISLSLGSGLKLYEELTSETELGKREWDTNELPKIYYLAGEVGSETMRNLEAKLLWKGIDDKAKITIVDMQVKVGSSDVDKNAKETFVRYYSSPPNPLPDKGKTPISFTYLPSDLNVGKLKPQIADGIRLLDSEGNDVTLSQEWNLTTKSGRDALKSFNGIVKADASDTITVSLEHENTGAKDEAKIYVYQIDLATNTKVIDPKLNGTCQIESTLKYPNLITPDIAVYDNNTKVKNLTKDSSNWDGKWGEVPNDGKFVDPKKYTIKAKVYKDVDKKNELDSESVDVYILRLGVTAIKFGGAGHVELQFHQNLETNKNSTTAHVSAYNEPWILCDLGQSRNADICTGVDRGKPHAIPNPYSERFFPVEGVTLPSSSVIYGSRSYPICYHRVSSAAAKPKITVTTSEGGYSQIQDRILTKDELGYSTCPFKIRLAVKFIKTGGDVELTSVPADANKNIAAATQYTFETTDSIEDSIGKSELTYEFSWFYKKDEKEVPIPGSLTTKHECFRIWDTPKTPWNTTTAKPWIKALDFAISTCGANGTNTKNALANITSYLHASYGLTYDTERGKRVFMSHGVNGVFSLDRYLIKNPGNVVNCYDQAGAVTTLGRIIGLDVNYLFMRPFGYIKETTLVGGNRCNNPFFTNTFGASKEKIITGLTDSAGLNRTYFNNHAFAEYDSGIFDACAGPELGTKDRGSYVNSIIEVTLPRAGNTTNIRIGSVTDVK